MTGPTHKVYSVCFAYIAAMLLFIKGDQLINYYLMIPIMLAMSKSGAIFPDLDHTWTSVRDKTLGKRIINIIIHITGGKHRSWQTHSIDIWIVSLILGYWIPNKLYKEEIVSQINKEILMIIILGFITGWMSHLFSDMLTSEGVRILCFLRIKVKFVPRKLLNLRFNTGNDWEDFNYKIMKGINTILGIICLAFPIIVKEMGI